MSFDVIAKTIQTNQDRDSLTTIIANLQYSDLADSYGSTLLMVAATYENLTATELLIEKFPHLLDKINDHSLNALSVAISKQNIPIIQYLLDRGCQLEIKAKDRKARYDGPFANASHMDTSKERFYDADNLDITALFQAIETQNCDILSLLIKHGANIKTKSASGKTTAFTLAAGNNDQKSLEILIANWSGPESIVPYLEGALRVAAKNGHTALVTFLLTQPNIDTNTFNSEGYCALMLAALYGHQEVVTLLLPKASSENRKMAYVHAARFAIENKSQEIVTLFSPTLDDINNVDQFGESILISVINKPVVLGKIIKRNKSILQINYKNEKKSGETALMRAVRQQRNESIQILLDNGADPSITDNNGHHPLLLALQSRNISAITAILPVLNLDEKNKDIINLGFSAIMPYASAQMVRLFIQHGADINASDTNKNSCIMLAIKNNNSDGFRELIKEKDIDLKKINQDGSTALSLAAEMNNLFFLDFFINLTYPFSVTEYYNAFYMACTTTVNNYRQTKEPILINLLKKFVDHIDFNQQHFYELKCGIAELAITNGQLNLLHELLNLKEPQKKGDDQDDVLYEKVKYTPLLYKAIATTNSQAFALVHDHILQDQENDEIIAYTSLLYQAIRTNNNEAFVFILEKLHVNVLATKEEFDFEYLMQHAIDIQSPMAVTWLLDMMIKKDNPITPGLLDSWVSAAEYSSSNNADAILDSFTAEAIAERYLARLQSLSETDTSEALINAAKPYKALIVQSIIRKPHIEQLKISIGAKGISFDQGLSKFLHTNTGSWLFPDTSVTQIKEAIEQRNNKMEQKYTSGSNHIL